MQVINVFNPDVCGSRFRNLPVLARPEMQLNAIAMDDTVVRAGAQDIKT